MSSRRDRNGQYTAYYQCTYYALRRCDAKEMLSSRSLDSQVADLLVRETTRLAGMVDFEEDKHLEPTEVRELRESLAGLEKLPTNLFVEKAKDGIRDQIASILSLYENTTKRSLLLLEELVQMFCDREYWDSRTSEDKKRIVKKAEGRRQKAEGLQYSVGFKPTLIASHRIRDFGGGLKPLASSGRPEGSGIPGKE